MALSLPSDAGRRWRFVQFCGAWYGVDGFNPPVVRQADCTFRLMGLAAPARPPIISAVGSGQVKTQRLKVRYAFYDPASGRESRLSPWSGVIRAAGNSIGVAGFLLPPVGASRLRIYANTDLAPDRAFFVSEIPFAASVTLDWSEDTLGFEARDQDGLPPIRTLIAAIDNRLYMAGSTPRDYGGQVALVQRDRRFSFGGGGAPTYLAGAYLVGDRMVVGVTERDEVYIASWDDVRQRGMLEGPWPETGGSYDYEIVEPRPAVMWSNIYPGGAALPEGWDPRNTMYVPCSDNEAVTGLVGYFGESTPVVGVFTERGIFYTSTRHEELRRSAAEIGTVSPDTVHAGWRGYIYYLGSDGQIYAWAGRTSALVSQANRHRIEDTLDYSRIDEAFAVYDASVGQDYYWLPVAGGGFTCHWYDHSIGEAFWWSLDVDKAWPIPSQGANQTMRVLVKDGSSYYLAGPGGEVVRGDGVWVSGFMDREAAMSWTVRRVWLRAMAAGTDSIRVAVLDECGEELGDATMLLDDCEVGPTVFRLRTNAVGLKLTWSATPNPSWQLRSVDAEVTPCLGQ